MMALYIISLEVTLVCQLCSTIDVPRVSMWKAENYFGRWVRAKLAVHATPTQPQSVWLSNSLKHHHKSANTL